MKNYEPGLSFGEDTARRYDKLSVRGDEAETVELLTELANGGPALELAIGIGRIALPLAAKGVRVDGIDISEAMVAQLRAKAGGDALNVTIGDFSEVPVEGEYKLIYIVFNTLHNLLTQEEQVRCFENVAKHLAADGVFLIEAATPADHYRLRNDQYVDAEALGVDYVMFDVAKHDPVKQLLIETHVTLTTKGTHLAPIVTRYIWPSELDLMARIAGLRLKQRWSGWKREPFVATSTRHVSVYGR